MSQSLELPSVLSERIKRIRNALNLSQAAFARRLGVNRAHVSRIESGKSAPSEQLLRLITHEYNISWPWLTKGKGHMELNFDEFQAHQQELKLASLRECLDVFYYINNFLLGKLVRNLDVYSLESPTTLPPSIIGRLKAIKEHLPLDKIHPLIDRVLANSAESESAGSE